ncbi:hypothetical protein CAPTEDRAFT_170489 [Capitella teleta]|uniref:TLC domain-containing protein n=1 Tax=Capitella teleta TaxID=283909 RepID=R7T7I2_CAPTE|nr:hypothetical protein CAPTEDRAFT_170489 [Capitella teleta]|eukprot:ELT87375.1 hypothetical protein CAPTEDRAFT_170489 [Capitella teleta]
MEDAFHGIQDWFWNEDFWLPPNVTWKDLTRDETTYIAYARDLWAVFPLAVLLFLIRLVWERVIALPIGRYFLVKESLPRPPQKCSVLEQAYKTHRRMLPSHNALQGYAKQLDWTPRQIERWWRRRRVVGKPSEMQRFRETTWRLFFYLTIFWSGVYILWDKPWIWDTKHCWYSYPRQHVTREIYWYYMIELAFYWSLVISLTIDNKRKDFTEMMVHHFATISLLGLSWCNNMVRIGTLVLIVHDAVDPILESTKTANRQTNFERTTDFLFICFTVMWFVTRLCIYPFRILKNTLFEGHLIVGMFPMYYVFNSLLCILQVLHILWFYLICRTACLYITKGQIDKDERSETEPESSSEEETDSVAKGDRVNGNNNLSNGRLKNKTH